MFGLKVNRVEFMDLSCCLFSCRMFCCSTTLSGVDFVLSSTTSSSSWPGYYRETAPSLSPGTVCFIFSFMCQYILFEIK